MACNLMWFRTDLRVNDNPALRSAAKAGESVIAVYCITPKTWQRHDKAPIQCQFILANLQCLSQSLAALNIPLLIKEVDYFSECADVIASLCDEHDCDAVYANKQYEVDEIKRDKKVSARLAKDNRVLYTCDDQVVSAPGEVLNKQGKAFKVFTPFKKAWLARVAATRQWQPNEPVKKSKKLSVSPSSIPNAVAGFSGEFDLSLYPAGEEAACELVSDFIQSRVEQYRDDRDFPGIEGTSRVSAYLVQGVISPRQCIELLCDEYKVGNVDELAKYEGAACWLSELVWREFYKHILVHFPAVCRHKPFKAETDKLHWSYDEAVIQAWCEGRTGVPIVDAGMRQLVQTGWMHNRLRMVTAMYLTKIAFVDWRVGERFFMQHLIDGDLAANNGGWQWSASTGTDAAPYFRIFNPTTQSERFDASGEFIRTFCPELAALDNKTIHDPYARGVKPGTLDYPLPVVDYKQGRASTIAAFKELT